MNSKTSCVERERPAEVDDPAPDSLNDGGDSEGIYTRVRSRRNPSGAQTAQRHQRYLWEDIFKTAFNTLAAAHHEPCPNLTGDIAAASATADLAVSHWSQRFGPTDQEAK